MAEKKAAKKIILEVPGQQYDVEKITQLALEDCKKNNKGAIKDFNVYIKPEDGKAYYTANNNKIAGNICI